MVSRVVLSIRYAILSILLFIALVLSLLYFSLKNGIRIESLHLPFIDVKQFYIKLDKKIIVNIEELLINKEKKAPTKEDLSKKLRLAKEILQYFEEIEIKKLSYSNYNVTFLYKDNIFYIDTDLYQLAAIIEPQGETLVATIPYAQIKKYHLFLFGDLSWQIGSEEIRYSGKFDGFGIRGQADIEKTGDTISFLLSSQNFTDLATIINLFGIKENVREWIYKRVAALSYRVEYLKGKIDIKNGRLHVDPEKIEGFARAFDGSILFHPELHPVLCKQIDVYYKNRSLDFTIHKPLYRDKKLDGSHVRIANLFKGDSKLFIDLKTSAPLDESILEILSAYHIKLPLRQLEGTTDARVSIELAFREMKTDIRGDFSTQMSLWRLKEAEFFINQGKVDLHNHLVTIHPSSVRIKEKILADLNGTIDTKAKKAELDALAHTLELDFDNQKILSSADEKFAVLVDWSTDATAIDIPDKKTQIMLSDKTATLFLRDLSLFKDSSPILKRYDIGNGNLTLLFRGSSDFSLAGKIQKEQKRLLDKSGAPVGSFDFTAKQSRGQWQASANNNRLTLALQDKVPLITIDGYDLRLDHNTSTNKEEDQEFTIIGKNSTIFLENRTLLSEGYQINLKKDFVNLFSTYKDSNLTLNKSGEYLALLGRNLNEESARMFLGFSGIKGGRYDISAQGDHGNLSGKILIKEAVFKDFALLNNILAFLNTAPALLSFSDPGFSQEGFSARDGFIDFVLKQNILTITQMSLTGKNTTVLGKGKIDLNNRTVDMTLTLQTARDVGKIISLIPVAGYILLGPDGTITTQIKIEGDIMKPSIASKLPEETLKAPINIIKRTLELPFKIFE